MEFSAEVLAWRNRGAFHVLAGREIFVLDTREPGRQAEPGPDRAREGVLVLHGFPTSSFDWHRALPILCARAAAPRRVVLFDFPGYGLSEKPAEYSYSLLEQAETAILVARAAGLDRVHLVAHDMGTSVACELVARRELGLLPFELASLVLSNGSVHLELAHLTPSQRLLRSPLGELFARLARPETFRAQLRRVFASPPPTSELDAMWAQLRHRGGHARLPRVISYLDERVRFARRWIGALERLDVPALVLWGREDPVAVAAIAEALAAEIPGARLRWLDGVGHYPMLEAPDRFGVAVAEFLAAHEGSPLAEGSA
ncbi:MAG: alpha/beta hydrolase [Polyangiaceae bacterium]|nr:alpha/beta hydrolase [Polyangiaceae bacterium]